MLLNLFIKLKIFFPDRWLYNRFMCKGLQIFFSLFVLQAQEYICNLMTRDIYFTRYNNSLCQCTLVININHIDQLKFQLRMSCKLINPPSHNFYYLINTLYLPILSCFFLYGKMQVCIEMSIVFPPNSPACTSLHISHG